MNAFLVIIVVAVIVEYALDLGSNLLNLKALKPEPPAELEGVYEPEKYRRSQEYTRETTRFGLVTSTFKLGLLLVFWFVGGFNYLDEVVRDLGYPAVVDGLLYIGILVIAYIVISLPLSVYSTFVIEERFEFNKTTPRTFVADRIKGLALAVVLGGPLLAAILAFFEYAGTFAWLYCWASVAVFSLAVQFVAPTWIMPLFNKFTPMEPGELKEAIFDLARDVEFTIDNIFVMDGSKRSGKANAFFTGFGRHKRIALFDTLVEKHTIPELVSVVAHEIAHYKKKHITQNMVIGFVHAGVVFFLLSIFLNSSGLYDAFFMDKESIYAGLLFFSLLYTPVEVLLSMALHMISRKHEHEADRWAVETVEEPQSLVAGLKKLSADSLSNLSPHPFYVFLNYSHPPLLQRVQAIESAAAKRSGAGAG